MFAERFTNPKPHAIPVWGNSLLLSLINISVALNRFSQHDTSAEYPANHLVAADGNGGTGIKCVRSLVHVAKGGLPAMSRKLRKYMYIA